MLPLCIIDDLLNLLKSRKRKRVLITGFGPFKHITENPSWKAVKDMSTKLKTKNHIIILSKEPIPVRYVDVDLIVKPLLDRKRPHLTIHVGVSEKVSCFVLEAEAKKKGYIQTDAAECKAARYQNPSPGLDSIVTKLDIATIQKEFNSLDDDLHAEISHNAGRFLCEYIYYTSLSLDRCPTLFVHIPLKKYTTEQLVRGLERIVELCANQLEKKTDMKPVAE